MRWDTQKLDADEPLTLPGLTLAGLLRSVRTPEFAGVTFHEVTCRSALNKVPDASRMPFRWTVNPTRGCLHACTYCLHPDTQILLADGRERALRDIAVGDVVMGTRLVGRYRRYVPSVVRDTWATHRRAYRVTLGDGTVLVASGDHRFLTPQGWKHVIGAMPGSGQRPYLTTNDELLGFGTGGRVPGSGAIDESVLRISNSCPEILATARHPLAALEVGHVPEAARSNGVAQIRVTGGLPARTKFFGETRLAISRKLELVGAAVKSDADLRVVGIEDLGAPIDLIDITTETGDFVANGVISHNCFARPTHEYLELDAGRDFETQIVVKTNIVDVLRAELARPSWAREHVALGTNTDPYQRVEGRYRFMPGIIEALAHSGTPLSVLTKGTLLRRDLPLLADAARAVPVGIGVSLAIRDEALQQAVEPGTPTPRARLDLVRAVRAAGLPCGVMVAPVLPWLTDDRDHLDSLLRDLADAGATGVTVLPLHLRGPVKPLFLAWLREHAPTLVPRYESLYGKGAYAPREYVQWLHDRVRPLLVRHGFAERSGHRAGRRDAPGEGTYPTGSIASAGLAVLEPPVAAAQPVLF